MYFLFFKSQWEIKRPAAQPQAICSEVLYEKRTASMLSTGTEAVK